MQYADYEDNALLERIAMNDNLALSELYDRYCNLVYSVAYGVIREHRLAEEITLDTFTRVWEKAESYEPGRASFSTWLTSITRNRSIDILRKEKVRPFDHSVQLTEVVPSSSANPEQAAERSLRSDRIHKALGYLPEEQRQVLMLVYFKGHTQREASEVLEIPLGTVKTRIRLAMKKLRDMLGTLETA